MKFELVHFNCGYCGKNTLLHEKDFSLDTAGIPLYWKGGKGPDRPDLAEYFYCSAECSLKDYEEEREQKKTK